MNFTGWIKLILFLLCPEATVITVWKMSVCKRGISKRGILKCSVSHVLNFRGWIELIYDKITLIYCVKNAFNPPLKFRTLKTGCFKMPHLQTGLQLPLGLVSFQESKEHILLLLLARKTLDKFRQKCQYRNV